VVQVLGHAPLSGEDVQQLRELIARVCRGLTGLGGDEGALPQRAVPDVGDTNTLGTGMSQPLQGGFRCGVRVRAGGDALKEFLELGGVLQHAQDVRLGNEDGGASDVAVQA
jgi:hypothetical protein